MVGDMPYFRAKRPRTESDRGHLVESKAMCAEELANLRSFQHRHGAFLGSYSESVLRFPKVAYVWSDFVNHLGLLYRRNRPGELMLIDRWLIFLDYAAVRGICGLS